jgi:parallel beta-helix repeat protein
MLSMLSQTAPNDANYTQQWAHQMIESDYAWNTTRGDSRVVIAIVDSGVDYNHPDLATNIWNNTDEIPNNGADDDDNGYADDVRGWDFFNNDSNPMDTYGHGTHCAGIVAAVTNNTIGVSGVSWYSTIMPIRVGDEYELPYSAIAEGIEYAANNGANIISMSFGGSYRSKVTYEAMKQAYEKGVLLVAAAGNDQSRIKTYPAAYDEVVAVAATDQNDYPAYFTNFGNWVEVAAPGVNILSTMSNMSRFFEYPYCNMSGTSMACPYVAGVAALTWSRFPNMTRDQVRYQLRRTAVDKGDPGFDFYFGYGRINASGAVNQDIPNHDLLVWSWKLPFVLDPDDMVTFDTTVFNFGESTEGNTYVKLLVNGTEVDSKKITAIHSGESATVSCSWTPTAEGKYNVTTCVMPVKGENIIENNAQSAYSWARYGKAVKVPDDFPTIRDAIDIANLEIYDGDATILVSNGIYNEYDLLIQNMLMSLTLAGESSRTTTISGQSGFDCVWVNADNVTIKGLTIENSLAGIMLWGSNCIVNNNNLTNNYYGIIVNGYYNNTVSDNTISKNGNRGIYLLKSSGDTIINNTVSTNGYGILLLDSANAFLTNNSLTGNRYGFIVDGSGLSHFIHNIGTSNTVDGKPIYYLVNQTNLVVDPSTFPNIGYLGLVNSTSISVKNLILSNRYQGVLFAYTTDSRIQNVTISKDYYGIFLISSNNTVISENKFIDNFASIYSTQVSNGNNIEYNEISDSDYSICLVSTSYSNVSGNTISNNHCGVYLSWSSNNSFFGNTLNGNKYGFQVLGDELNHFMHSIDESNLVNGKPVYYLVNQKDLVVNSTTHPQVGYLALVNSTNVAVEGLTLTNNGKGLLFAYTNNSRITNNNVTNNYDGIYLQSCFNNSVSENNLIDNNSNGVCVDSSFNNSISGNNMINNNAGVDLCYVSFNNSVSGNNITNNYNGVALGSCFNNSVSGNNITNGGHGVVLLESFNNSFSGNAITNNNFCGVELYYSSCNSIFENHIVDNEKGIKIAWYSNKNSINDNMLIYNDYGIYLALSDDNAIHHNNFINNTCQVYIFESYSNTWNSINLVGNYWSNYNGTDTDGDGIGDTLLPHEGVDWYPLIWKWFPGDLDGDGDVDRYDLGLFVFTYGSEMGDPNYNRLADLDYDRDVDDDDFAIFEQNYGKTDP